MTTKDATFWKGPGSCSNVMAIALPLVISTSAFTLQMFIDRVFLMWYESEAMAATMFAGHISFTIFSLFLGTASYVNTFVAQYDGAGRKEGVAASVWQGIYFSLAAGVFLGLFYFLAEPIVRLAGHSPGIQVREIIYFKILCFGAIFGLVSSTISCFYTGRGKTWTVMKVNVAATIFNVVFDYLLIFGNFGFPEMGIAGAALATILSSVLSCVVYLILFFTPHNRLEFETLSKWHFKGELFRRLMRFGVPSGVQFMLDMLGFAMFITFVGRIDDVSFAATTMAFQINSLAFMPMIGFSIAVSVLVGQALGKDDVGLAVKSTWSAAFVTFAYMFVITLGYVFTPRVFIAPFAVRADAAELAMITPLVIHLLWFVAAYCLFDTGNLIFSAALKGAGDTRFVMYVSVILNWVILVVPSYLAIRFAEGRASLYWAWGALSAYVCMLAIVFLLRFLAGHWKEMRVIEAAPTPPMKVPETRPFDA